MGKRILIADAGSTDTKWLFVPDLNEISKEDLSSDSWLKKIISFQSEGINPLQQKIEKILQILDCTQSEHNLKDINSIYFYGAGCISYQSNMMKYHLKEVFGNVEVEVDSDLIGAAKALFRTSDGIACILGTGSNSGVYKEEKISNKIPALGYVLGDEGSGAALGKRLLNGLFKMSLSPDLLQKFRDKYNLSLDDIIMNVYRRPRPSHFLASFSPFILQNLEDKEIKKLVETELGLFFEKNLLPYQVIVGQEEFKSYKIGFSGSIAFYYEEILKTVASKYGIEISKIIQTPIFDLGKFILTKEICK